MALSLLLSRFIKHGYSSSVLWIILLSHVDKPACLRQRLKNSPCPIFRLNPQQCRSSWQPSVPLLCRYPVSSLPLPLLSPVAIPSPPCLPLLSPPATYSLACLYLFSRQSLSHLSPSRYPVSALPTLALPSHYHFSRLRYLYSPLPLPFLSQVAIPSPPTLTPSPCAPSPLKDREDLISIKRTLFANYRTGGYCRFIASN
jgi:hypothetical protein